MWFSCDKKQSIYHIFNNGYERYKNLINSNRKKCFWPTLYTFNQILPLKLLEINFVYNIYGNHTYNVIYNSKTYELNSFINEFKLIIKFVPNCNNNFAFECNIKILNMIRDNEILREFDGYICANDQDEIALLNPESKLICLEDSIEELKSIENLNLNFHIFQSDDYYVNAVKIYINDIFYNLIFNIYDYKECLTFDIYEQLLHEYRPKYHNIYKDILSFLKNNIDSIIDNSKEIYNRILIQNKYNKYKKFNLGMPNVYFDTQGDDFLLGMPNVYFDTQGDDFLLGMPNFVNILGIEDEHEDINEEDYEDINKEDISEEDYQNLIINIDKNCNYELLKNIIENPSFSNNGLSISEYINKLLEDKTEYYKNINEIIINYYHYYNNYNYLYKHILINILSIHPSLTLYYYDVNSRSYNMIINSGGYKGLNIIFSSI